MRSWGFHGSLVSLATACAGLALSCDGRHLACEETDCLSSCSDLGYASGACAGALCTCAGPSDGDADADADACDGVACSGHGACVAEGEGTWCDCFTGFHAVGLECIASSGDAGPDGDRDATSDADQDGREDADLEGPCVPGCARGSCGAGDWTTVCAGTFLMGAPVGEVGSRENERPRHLVTLTHDYAILATEVTQGEFESAMGFNPSTNRSCGRACPVETVSWHAAAAYCNALSADAGLEPCYSCTGTGTSVRCVTRPDRPSIFDCPGVRLPTEAEWEHAARAGTETATYNGDITDEHSCAPSPVLDPIAWWCGNAAGFTMPVATRAPNAWGLHDVLGNVSELCHDFCDAYTPSPAVDPDCGSSGAHRALRGGVVGYPGGFLRAAVRGGAEPESEGFWAGFRPVRTLRPLP